MKNSTPASLLAFLGWFVGTTLLLLGGVALFSWLVNPWGLYGPDLLPPVLWNGPRAAVERWEQSSRDAEVLIIGSSRVEALRCSYVTEAVGQSCFNATAHGSFFEEQFALLNHLLETHQGQPQKVLLGIEVRTFPNNEVYGAQVVMTDELLPYISAETRRSARLHNAKRLIAVGQLKDALRSVVTQLPDRLRQPATDPVEPQQATAPVQAQPGAGGGAAADHGAVFRANIDQSIALFLEHYGPLDGLSAERLADLDALIEQLRVADIELILFVTPTYGDVLSAINESTPYATLQYELNNFVATQVPPIPLYDFQTVDQFGGSERDFVSADHLHPESETARLFVEALLQP